ncbi:MAG: class 1 fructose-bisphosphatase [Rhodobacteraceae bacterium]|jgi:fructose-1,6-bisphosphatase I|uniref:Fructose-1,6-bisphosphatase class 1 n=1 Tax=Salipiger profundus TaxID=1229727 RepID=A0A1U7D6N1_9RHOB|nr:MULTISPECIES: class 1 fructose-bisphosphatase [Salipiger]APX23811.1 D-fructose 1,6-bisphosphatase [Salipiger profundus]MAB07034.1 class 1 fructose-bisphosphatase [Paracoccaceae bacterium]GGA18147.1 fructose-1,6-bisphosphatase class 1 1 [Salipiger profundus]SFD28428.1 D-fructose 1,6-bisphosphatase [Salipiger profundus]
MTDRNPYSPDAPIPARLRPAMEALGRVGRDLSRRIARGPLGGQLAATVGDNADGDRQKALDVLADEAFARDLAGTGVRWYASEEQEGVVELDPRGTLALAIDPLDGSSNIETNVSIGTIFSIREAGPEGEASFLRPGHEQIAAGYIIYGPQCMMLVTFGDGVQDYILDPETGRFTLVNSQLTIPGESAEFAINASNYRHWSKPVRAYIDDCLAGSEGPRAKNFNMRWIASLVAETHRILVRGGLFLYPRDDRPGYDMGRLRMVYECAPIAMLVEQAQGRATDTTTRILDKVPAELHARTPFVFGSITKVDRVTAYHDLPEQEVSALFGNRGLFRV